MKTKIFTLFFALIASVCMTKAATPTVDDLAEMYDVANNVVFCLQFTEEAEVCNDVVYEGNTIDYEELRKLDPLPEFEGWYALEVPYSEYFEGQIFIMASNGEFNRDYQTGDKDAWVHVDGLELSIDYVQFTYVGEWFIHVPAPGAYIYQITYWKDHANPCAIQQIGDLFYKLDKENKTAEVTYQFGSNNYSGMTTVSIPDSVIYNEETYNVTGIGDYAFNCCPDLISIEIPNSVTSIGYAAFAGCVFTSIDIPNSVTSIGDHAFSSCRSLISIEIPNSVTSLGNYVFYECRGLTSITIGNGVTSVGGKIFYYCTSLTDIYATCGDLERVQQLFNNDSRIKYKPLPYTITTNAVNGTIETPQNSCDALELTAVPDQGFHFVQWSDGNTDNPRAIELTQDTTMEAVFELSLAGMCGKDEALTWTLDTAGMVLSISGAGELTDNYTYTRYVESVIIGNEITSIGKNAFAECNLKDSIIIGSSVKVIEREAFKYAHYDSIYPTITCYSQRPPTVREDAFDEDMPYSTIVYVPAAYLETYLAHDFWGLYDVRPLGNLDAIEEIEGRERKPVSKRIRDGQILILRGEKVYTVTGQEVK